MTSHFVTFNIFFAHLVADYFVRENSSVDIIFGTSSKFRLFIPPKRIYFYILAGKILGGQHFLQQARFSELLFTVILSDMVHYFS